MDMRRARAAFGLSLLGMLVMSGCGGGAESQEDESAGLPAAEAQPAPPDAPVAEPAPAPVELTPAAPAAPAPATRAPSRPASRPAATRPASGTAGGSYPSTPVEPRPEATPSPEARREMRTLAAGRTLALNAEAEVTTESSLVGDEVTATISEDILGSSGEVLLPIGTRLKGKVVESRESTNADELAVLRVEFQSVTVNGVERPIKATVTEMDVEAQARDSNTRTAAKVGVGAAAGAIVGRILGGDRKDAVKGAVVGGAAGTAAAIATKSGHATLKPGARIVLRLDEALLIDG